MSKKMLSQGTFTLTWPIFHFCQCDHTKNGLSQLLRPYNKISYVHDECFHIWKFEGFLRDIWLLIKVLLSEALQILWLHKKENRIFLSALPALKFQRNYSNRHSAMHYSTLRFYNTFFSKKLSIRVVNNFYKIF